MKLFGERRPPYRPMAPIPWSAISASLRDHYQEKRQAMEQKIQDLDETRRLLYMVLVDALDSDRWYTTAGTLINALAHHSQLVTAAEAEEQLLAIHANGVDEQGRAWVEGLIARITEELDPSGGSQ